MSRGTRNRLGAALAAALSAGLLLTGCTGAGAAGGSDASNSGTPTAAGVIGNQADGGTPVDGGTFTYASYSPVSSLDPVIGKPAGWLGGTEMAAIYDVLMRHDDSVGGYVPQLAESLTESDDHLTWTLKLRPGVTFSDGSAFNAQAVVDGTNRFNTGGGDRSVLFIDTVDHVRAVDDFTVVYSLNRPWNEFPSSLTAGHGMIAAASSYAGEKFTPIGAGPFTLENFAPGVEVAMKARPDYWGGKPHIDNLKFVDIKGEQPRIDALATDGIQMTYLRNSDTIAIAKEKFSGYYEPVSVIDAGQINAREGRPGSDVRVRKAMALAINPEVINQRARSGFNSAGSDLFQPWSKWSGEVTGLPFDPVAAKKLLDEAKADGYDGRLTYVTPQIQGTTELALASQSMLQAVGFTVDIKYLASVTDLAKTLFVTHEFDMSAGGFGLPDAAPLNRLYSALSSSSSENVGGFKSEKVDQLLEQIQTATTDEAKREAFQALQAEMNESVPFLVWASGSHFVPWADNVHGVQTSMGGLALFDEVWLSK